MFFGFGKLYNTQSKSTLFFSPIIKNPNMANSTLALHYNIYYWSLAVLNSLPWELITIIYADFVHFPCSTNEEDSRTSSDNYRFLNISIKSQADLEING